MRRSHRTNAGSRPGDRQRLDRDQHLLRLLIAQLPIGVGASAFPDKKQNWCDGIARKRNRKAWSRYNRLLD